MTITLREVPLPNPDYTSVEFFIDGVSIGSATRSGDLYSIGFGAVPVFTQDEAIDAILRRRIRLSEDTIVRATHERAIANAQLVKFILHRETR